MIKIILKFTGFFILFLLSAGSAYYGYELYSAHHYTKETVLADFADAQWKRPDTPPVPFEITSQELSPRQLEILIRVQDPRFFHHKGLDFSTPGAGLTTITQAIVKQLYFNPFKPGIAKVKQSLIARFIVHNFVSKQDQLTLFLNTLFFGRVDGKPVTGLASAAQAYYQCSVNDLTEDQYISLIAMIVMPGTFHLLEHPEWNAARVSRIKSVLAGEYQPRGFMDQFYGELPQEVIDAGLPPASYFPD